MTSRPLASNSSFFAYRLPGAGLRLTPEEWALIVGALRAYQHNNTYRPLYEKFEAQGAGVMPCAAPPGGRLRLNPRVLPDR